MDIVYFIISFVLVVIMGWVAFMAGVQHGIKKSLDEQTWLSHSKGVTDPEAEIAFLSVVRKMYNTFVKKNHDYGSAVAMGGVKGIVLRIGDKVARLWTLSGLKEDQPTLVNESLTDSLLDVANYAIIGYLMAAGIWNTTDVNAEVGKKAIASLLLNSLNDLDEETVNELYAAFITREIAATLDKNTYTLA